LLLLLLLLLVPLLWLAFTAALLGGYFRKTLRQHMWQTLCDSE